jgi:hypothetical protein
MTKQRCEIYFVVYVQGSNSNGKHIKVNNATQDSYASPSPFTDGKLLARRIITCTMYMFNAI